MLTNEQFNDAFSPETCFKVMKTALQAELDKNPRYGADPQVDMILVAVAASMSQLAYGLRDVLDPPPVPQHVNEPAEASISRLHSVADRMEGILQQMGGTMSAREFEARTKHPLFDQHKKE